MEPGTCLVNSMDHRPTKRARSRSSGSMVHVLSASPPRRQGWFGRRGLPRDLERMRIDAAAFPAGLAAAERRNVVAPAARSGSTRDRRLSAESLTSLSCGSTAASRTLGHQGWSWPSQRTMRPVSANVNEAMAEALVEAMVVDVSSRSSGASGPPMSVLIQPGCNMTTPPASIRAASCELISIGS